MRKFTNIYMLIITLLIIFGVIGVLFVGEPNAPEEVSQTTINNTPGYSTMVSVAEIAGHQLLENAILDIQVTPKETAQDVTIDLQSSEFMTEDTLLKDSYNILQDMGKIEDISTVTLIWHMLVKNDNTVVLTIKFTKEGLQQLQTDSYTVLPKIASTYEKHESLK